MRVLLINQVFSPDVAATAQHAHDLGRHLVRQGHEVDVIAGRSLYGQKGAQLPRDETIDGIRVHRVGMSLFGKAGILLRALDFVLMYIAMAFRAMTVRRPDVVVCFTTPPFIALAGLALRMLRGAKFVYWVMDLYPDAPVACGVMRETSPLTRFFEWLNRLCLRRADRVVVLGRCMEERIRAKGIAGDHVVHIGVWSPEEPTAEIGHEDNPYRREWALGDRFVVMYSGNFGLGHDVQTMCEAAARLDGDDAWRFVFVGGGKKKAEVEAFVKERCLKNAILAPYQPREKLAYSLSCADVHLATLMEGCEGIMVPCKLFGSMGVGRPTVFIGHPSSELARVLTENECGLAVRQGDVDGLVAALTRLKNDRALCRRMGENARRSMKDVYDQTASCEAWRRLLEETVSGRAAAPAARRSDAPSAPAAQAAGRDAA